MSLLTKSKSSLRPERSAVSQMNRRHVLQGLGFFSLLSPPLVAQTEESADFLKHHPAFDLHCHPGVFLRRGAAEYPGDQAPAKTISEMREGGLAAGFFSVVADAKILGRDAKGIVVNRAFADGEAWADCKRQLINFDDLVKREKISFATSLRQMEALRKRGQLAAFLSCEGGDCLEGNLGRLEYLYQRGVRSLQLVHYAQNTLGDLQTQPLVYNGLSAFGRDVVRRMNRLGMVVDMAHAAFATVKATVDSIGGPIMLSHSHLQSESSPHPRLITVEHARLVASTGGVIGAWPSGFANRTFADFVDQTMRLVDAVGVDHVGLGTDMDSNFQPVFSSYRQLPDWITALRAKGLSEGDVAKIAGGNAMRVLAQVLKA
jgi:membrane dipeptidase